jgi:hypothetical protein
VLSASASLLDRLSAPQLMRLQYEASRTTPHAKLVCRPASSIALGAAEEMQEEMQRCLVGHPLGRSFTGQQEIMKLLAPRAAAACQAVPPHPHGLPSQAYTVAVGALRARVASFVALVRSQYDEALGPRTRRRGALSTEGAGGVPS